MRNPLIALTLVAAVLPLSPAVARQSNGYVVRTTTMRAGPAYDYPAVQRLYRNSSVAVYGCLRDWSWCDVGTRYARGWVARRDLSVSYLGRRRNVGSSIGLVIVTFSFGNYWDNHYRTRPFYSQRTRWQQQYTNNYRPEWGPRPRPQTVAPQPRPPRATRPVPQSNSGAKRIQPAPAPRAAPPQKKPQTGAGNDQQRKSEKGRKPPG